MDNNNDLEKTQLITDLPTQNDNLDKTQLISTADLMDTTKVEEKKKFDKNIYIFIIAIVAVAIIAFAGGKSMAKDKNSDNNINNTESQVAETEEKNEDESDSCDEALDLNTRTGKQLTISYTSNQFILSGINSSCDVNFDKLYSKNQAISKGEIASTKIMTGFLKNEQETAVIVMKDGTVYTASINCDGEIDYKQDKLYEGEKIKEILEVSYPSSCGYREVCYQVATVKLQDGTTKTIKKESTVRK